MRWVFVVFVIGVGILAPRARAYAGVIINEIAYAGTETSQYEEWIELYNNGNEVISLNNWIIYKESTVLFTLTQSIEPGEYLLICRTTGSLTNPLNGSCHEKGAFGGSGLSNTGEHLILKSQDGSVVDEIERVDNKWPIPSIPKGYSMQKTSDGVWIKATPTPATPNTDEDIETGEPPQSTNQPSITIERGATIIDMTTTGSEAVEFVKPDVLFSAKMTSLDYGLVGSPLPFSVQVTEDGKRDLVSGVFEWYMGDGTLYRYTTNTSFSHSFDQPGIYQITLVYYSNIFKTDPDSIHRKKITILDPQFEIETSSEGTLTLYNNAEKDIDIQGWSLVTKDYSFTFPKYTIISKKSGITFSPRVLGFWIDQREQVNLLNPQGHRVPFTIRREETLFLETSHTENQPETLVLHGPSRTIKTPSLRSFSEIWNSHRWYIIGVGVLISILAYLGFHLYATRNTLIQDIDEDESL